MAIPERAFKPNLEVYYKPLIGYNSSCSQSVRYYDLPHGIPKC